MKNSSHPPPRIAGAGIPVVFGLALSAAASPGLAQVTGGYPSLPPVAVDVRTGDLRQQLAAYQFEPPARGLDRAFNVGASLGVDVGITDNALEVQAPRRADVFTVISPELVVSGETSRAKLDLAYSPRISLYASNGSQNRVDQSLNAGLSVVLVPQTLFLDLRAAIQQQSRTGNFGAGNTGQLNRNDQIQSTTISATPYVQHRFGGWGTVRAGYSFLRTLQDARGDNTNFNNATLFNQGFNQGVVNNQGIPSNFNNGAGITGNLTTERERAAFTSGENFGRFNDILEVEAVQYHGAGAYHGAYRNLVNNGLGYAVTRTVTVEVGAGYQQLRFSGTPGYRVSEPIWNAGVRWAPTIGSSITVGYGRRDGAGSLYLDAAASPTARTRVFARYSQGISTSAEDQQNLLSTTSIGSTGELVDSATGAPVASSSANFGTQNGLYRLRRFSANASYILDRDSFNLSLSNEDRTILSPTTFGPDPGNGGLLPVLPTGSSSNGTFVTLSWQHELTPVLTTSTSVTYGTTSYSGLTSGPSSNTTTNSISAQAALSYSITESLSGSIRYLYSERSSSQAQTIFGTQGSVTENVLYLGLRKRF